MFGILNKTYNLIILISLLLWFPTVICSVVFNKPTLIYYYSVYLSVIIVVSIIFIIIIFISMLKRWWLHIM